MCIHFLYINNSAEDGEYQVIIANNRDESFKRKTKPAHLWNKTCISGVDLEPGREGGTWIAINTETGRIGTLLNILQNKKPDPNKLGRGCLVVDYISGSESPLGYLKGVQQNAPDFNPFNLVLMENKSDAWHCYQYSCSGDMDPTEITDQVFGVSNSRADRPYQKVLYGKQQMHEITGRLHRVEQEDDLVAELMVLLNDSTSRMPDSQLRSQAEGYLSETLMEQRSAVYVDSKQINYGTRTNTVILIEKSGRGKYIERTMREPVDTENIVWDTNVIPFQINK